MSTLIIVSNRCITRKTTFTDPLLDVLEKIAINYSAKWYGWDGEIETSRKGPQRSRHDINTFTVYSRPFSANEYENGYHGYIHKVLWPVFHNRPDLAEYQKEYFTTYKMNAQNVAEDIAQDLRDEEIIWVHDYHLLPVGKMLRDGGHHNMSGFFLHQPFPPGDVLRSIPEHNWLVNALLEYDVIGFQSSADVSNFLTYVLRYHRVTRLAPDLIQLNGKTIRIGIFPCGIVADAQNVAPPIHRQVDDYPRQIIISNDVISDISGIHYRLDAMRTFLNHHPQYIRNISLLQISDPSREYPRSTSNLCTRLERFCGELNGQYGDFSWYPVNYIHNTLCSQTLIQELYAKAQVALFTPLSEGTSLSAKAFILAQDVDDPGVLILSMFSGAAEQLSEAIIVNPYDANETSDALHSALSMPLHERKRRHGLMLKKVLRYDSLWWGRTFIEALEDKTRPAAPVFRTSHYGVFTPQKLY